MGTDTLSSTQHEARHAAQTYLESRLAGGQLSGPKKAFEIPVIDIEPSFSPSLDDRKAVAAQIREACVSSGFFHIIGHGVPEDIRQSIIKLAERFFKSLSPEKKAAMHVKQSPYFRGWEPSDYTYVNPGDWSAEDSAPETKEAFNWGYEAGLDATGGDGLYRELDGSKVKANVWPSEEDMPGFYEGIKEYYSVLLELARHMFRLFALSLDLEEDYFDAMLTHPGAIARLLYYPSSTDPRPLDTTQKDKEVGLGAHSDYECFTILLSSSLSGLEVLSPDDEWIEASTVEGAFTVNIADFMMRWTNGVYRSTIHRVVNRTSEARYSVPLFYSVNYDEVIETLPSCITPDNPSKFPPIKAGEYILARLKATAANDA